MWKRSREKREDGRNKDFPSHMCRATERAGEPGGPEGSVSSNDISAADVRRSISRESFTVSALSCLLGIVYAEYGVFACLVGAVVMWAVFCVKL